MRRLCAPLLAVVLLVLAACGSTVPAAAPESGETVGGLQVVRALPDTPEAPEPAEPPRTHAPSAAPEPAETAKPAPEPEETAPPAPADRAAPEPEETEGPAPEEQTPEEQTPEEQTPEEKGDSAPEEQTPEEREAPGPEETPSSAGDYVLNLNTKKFHLPECSSVQEMKPANRKDVHMTREEILEMGFVPCKRCKP